MSKIQKQSRRVRILFQFLFVIVPIMVCYYWLTIGTPYEFIASTGIIQTTIEINNYTNLPLTLTTRLLAILASIMLCSITMYALRILITLFRNYESNKIFSIENTKYYKKLGYSIFYWVGGSILYRATMSVILSFNNPPGQRYLFVSFIGVDFLTILFGFVVLIISWIMKEGYILADENNFTV